MAVKEGSFGARLKQLREAAGLSQAALAGRAGLHPFGVAKIEQGLRSSPGWDTVLALARALGVGVAAFEEGTAGDAPAADALRRWSGSLLEALDDALAQLERARVIVLEGQAAPRKVASRPRKGKAAKKEG